MQDGLLDDEVVPVEIPQKNGPPRIFREDEELKRLNEAKARQIQNF
ncbi:unnamed protein product [Anisakis simplex]|uniref:Uncharacterized protein n=1 Tax=Anisakis simplex TaxID=6269 RepID=A0A3P6PSC0_ANISI|nr:unnamed protein product [Anisakis simplex]